LRLLPNTNVPTFHIANAVPRSLHTKFFINNSWGYSLELMHHYTVTAAGSVVHRPDIQHVWQNVIPQIAYDYPYVMHGTLAIAAMHKAYLLPAQHDKYMRLAIQHQTAGLEGFRTALAVMSSQDWEPLFCFGAMVAANAMWHFPKGQQEENNQSNDELEMFVYIRGMRTLMLTLEPNLANSRLAPMAKGIAVSELEYESSSRYVTLIDFNTSGTPLSLIVSLSVDTHIEQSRRTTRHFPISYQKRLTTSASCTSCRCPAVDETSISMPLRYSV
jgi:transcription factor-like protein